MIKQMMAALSFSASLLVLSAGASAGTFQEGTADGIGFAKDQQAYINGFASGQDGRASEYGGSGSITESSYPKVCDTVGPNGERMCGGENIAGKDAPTHLYNKSLTEIQQEAAVKATTDETAQYAFAARQDREDFAITRKDPLFKHESSNQQQMLDLSETYSDCKQIAYGIEGETTSESCQRTSQSSFLEVECHRSWTGYCDWVPAIKYDMSKGSASKVTSMTRYTVGGSGSIGSTTSDTALSYYNISVTSNYTVDLYYDTLTDDTFYRVEFTRWVADTDNPKEKYLPTLTINGVTVPRSSTTLYGCCAKKTYQYKALWKNIKSFMVDGANTVSVNFQGGSVGTHQIFNLKETQICNKKYTEAFFCNGGRELRNATLLSSQCNDSADRTYQGTVFNKACWEQTEVYKSEFPENKIHTEEAKCADLRNAGCGVVSTVCNDPSCTSSTLNFACHGGATETMSVCGDTLVCPGGDCAADAKPPATDNTQDFLQSASYIAMMNDMKKEFDPQNITVWKGEFKQCELENIAGLSDKCCSSGGGFSTDVGITSCSTEEKAIMQAKKDGRVTMFRQYTTCSSKVAGVCVKEVEHYLFCVWPSKLARIIQVQGRAQLGQAIGESCAGFKLQDPNELQALNWSQIDLSEYFGDVQSQFAATAKPTGDALTQGMLNRQQQTQEELANKMEQYYGTGQ